MFHNLLFSSEFHSRICRAMKSRIQKSQKFAESEVGAVIDVTN